MPFKLCKSEKKRLDELFDHVKELSDTVDELRAEVDAMKIHSVIASNESLARRRNECESKTLRKLKRCLEKSFVPVFLRDPTYKVRKKCQQLLSQFPTIMSRPDNLTCNERPVYEHLPSYAKADAHRFTHKRSPFRYSDETKPKRRERNVKCPSQCRRNVSQDSQQAKLLQTSLSSSKNSLAKPYESYNTHCTYKTCNSLKSSRKVENSGQFKKKIAKKKTTGTYASISSSSIRVSNPTERIIDSETVKQQRSVTFVDREKKVPLQKDSSLSYSLSSTNIPQHQDCSVIYAKPKTDFNVRKTTTAPEKTKKRSRSAQCSIDCEYFDKLPSHQKDICTSTLSDNLGRVNSTIKKRNVEKAKRKTLTSQEMQTLKINKYNDDICFTGRRQYCPKAKRSCVFAGSLSSLTSCSPRSISSFCLGSEDLGKGLMKRHYKRERMSEDTFEKKRTAEELEQETDNVGRVKLFSSREASNKSAKVKNPEPRSNRRKRTYVISSDIPARKTREIAQCNFYEEQTNSSSFEDSIFQERNMKRRKMRKTWKKPEAPLKVCEGHHLRNNQYSSPEKYGNHTLKSGRTNRRTERLFPKSEQLSHWKVQEWQEKSVKFSKFPKSTSSSSRVCTDETCSLTSNPALSRSDGGSITSVIFNRKEKPTKDFNA